MTERNDDSDAVSEECAVCGRPVADDAYPRHRLTLEDETGEHHEHRVCPDCWEELRETVSSPARRSEDGE